MLNLAICPKYFFSVTFIAFFNVYLDVLLRMDYLNVSAIPSSYICNPVNTRKCFAEIGRYF